MAKRPFPSYWMFRDKEGHWRWNFAGRNGKIVAASTVAYMRKQGCIRAIQMVKGSAQIPVWGPEADVKAIDSAPQGSATVEITPAE